jgi:hypothetical protein
MSLGDRVLTFERNIVPLYLRVEGQVDEEVTLDEEHTSFLCNIWTSASQCHIPEDCTVWLHHFYNIQNHYFFIAVFAVTLYLSHYW